MSFSGLFIFFIKILTFGEGWVTIILVTHNKNTVITKVKIKESLFMKKLKVVILALSLGVACVGNQIKLAATEPNSQESANLMQSFDLPLNSPNVEQAVRMYYRAISSRIDRSMSAEDLTRNFRQLDNTIRGMNEDDRKYFFAEIVSYPIISNLNESLSVQDRVDEIGRFLLGIYNNVDSVEWNINSRNHRGIINLVMKNIPNDIREILNLLSRIPPYALFIRVQGNTISYSF